MFSFLHFPYLGNYVSCCFCLSVSSLCVMRTVTLSLKSRLTLDSFLFSVLPDDWWRPLSPPYLTHPLSSARREQRSCRPRPCGLASPQPPSCLLRAQSHELLPGARRAGGCGFLLPSVMALLGHLACSAPVSTTSRKHSRWHGRAHRVEQTRSAS